MSENITFHNEFIIFAYFFVYFIFYICIVAYYRARNRRLPVYLFDVLYIYILNA